MALALFVTPDEIIVCPHCNTLLQVEIIQYNNNIRACFIEREKTTLRQVTKHLFNRYISLAQKFNTTEPGTEVIKLCKEGIAQINNHPIDKLNRWLGYVQGVLITCDVTTVMKERDYSRPLFHAAYKYEGIEIPQTKEIN